MPDVNALETVNAFAMAVELSVDPSGTAPYFRRTLNTPSFASAVAVAALPVVFAALLGMSEDPIVTAPVRVLTEVTPPEPPDGIDAGACANAGAAKTIRPIR